MKRSHALTFADDLPQPRLSQLEAVKGAAWLIDVTGGRILAATVAGGRLLGLDPRASTPLLDAAMPALARLRALASDDGRDAAAPAPLVFWTRNGAVRRHCRIQFLRDAPSVLAVVVAVEENVADVRLDTHAPPSLFISDDAAKLKEIARRIREGQASERTERRSGEGKGSSAAATSPVPDASHDTTPQSEPAVPVSLRASLAHELKTPVSAIAVAAEIMKDEHFGPLGSARYVGYAADIHGNAQHMLRLIDRMLAEGAEVIDTQLALNFAELDAAELLVTAVSQLQPLAERTGITLALELAPRLPHVIADATSLRQILFNILTNAFKFTDRGGSVTVAARYGGEGPLTIAISDTGRGMDERELNRLLAPSYEPRPAQRAGARGAGLGLGLPLAQALAAKNGAELAIDSVPNKGTTVSIAFAKDRVIPV